MAKVILGMTMSLDGFINDRSGSVELLYPDLAAWGETELGKESIRNTGAVVMGSNSFAMAEDPDWFAGNYEYQVPIFVITHRIPKRKPKETAKLSFTIVTDGIESAVRQERATAGHKAWYRSEGPEGASAGLEGKRFCVCKVREGRHGLRNLQTLVFCGTRAAASI